MNEYHPRYFAVEYSSPDLHMRMSICDAIIHWFNLLSAGLGKTTLSSGDSNILIYFDYATFTIP